MSSSSTTPPPATHTFGAQPTNRTIFTADNLPVLRGIDSETIDLIYLDPPFNTGKQWHAPIGSDAEGASFNDIWAWDDVAAAAGETLATSVKRQWLNALHIESPIRAVVETAEATAGEEMGAYLAFMAMRLVEMHRVLKPTGSIYLHCDDVADAYLKLLLDAVFGDENFRNSITWRRHSGKALSIKKYARNSDRILYFRKSKASIWNQQYEPYSDEHLKTFRYEDAIGRYGTQPLTGGRPGGPDAYTEFRGLLPSGSRAWAPPRRQIFPLAAQAKLPDNYENMRVIEKCEALDEAGLIHWSNQGTPSYKNYLSMRKGSHATDIIADIKRVYGSENTGYPTQKPLALLKRFILASSNPGDIVLDPFCGCATACVAAEKLGRRWIGIDVSELAVLLCDDRIQKMQNETGQTNFGIPYHDPIHRTDIPERTDATALIDEMPIDLSVSKDYVKQRLYEQQAGICNGCERHFPPEFSDLMDLDHIKPKSRGGLHTWNNVQLLCRTCNVRKGSGTMAQLKKRLAQDAA